jgi:hypothetical protein
MSVSLFGGKWGDGFTKPDEITMGRIVNLSCSSPILDISKTSAVSKIKSGLPSVPLPAGRLFMASLPIIAIFG